MHGTASHEGNAGQNHSEILSHICQIWLSSKRQETITISWHVGKRESLCNADEIVNWSSHYEK